MPEVLSPSATHGSQTKNRKNENDEWQKILIALLFLLFSFSCIFCSSQTALLVINRDRIDASMQSRFNANYDPAASIALAPLSEDIAAEAARDEELLAENHTILSQGMPIAILPIPVPTPILLPLPTPTSLPTEDPAPTSIAVIPTPTSPPTSPPPTSPPPTSPPPTSPPTSPPPTSPPTSPPPTSPPPTSPPPTSPPPTSPPPTSPPPTSPPPTSPPPTHTPVPVTISISDASVIEGDIGPANAVFIVTLSSASSDVVRVDYRTVDNTATAPTDYTAIPTTTLIFPSGTLTRLITVTVQGDTLYEYGETFFVNLTNPRNATISDNQGQGIIVNDDPLPTIQFSNPAYSVNEDAGSVTIDTTLSPAAGITVTVAYTSNDITALANEDYVAVSDTLNFDPGQTNLTFTVTITDDTLDEPDEIVELRLGNPTNAQLGTFNPITLTIVDNDDKPGDCSGIYPPGEPNIGPPNGIIWRVACSTSVVVDLQTPITVDGNPDFDLVYYEAIGRVPPLTPPDMIYMDLVTVQIGVSPAGPWYTIFEWGDGITDTNTNLVGGITEYPDPGPGSADNTVMRWPPLVGTTPYTTGIQIDVDNPPTGAPPPGDYQYIRIVSPASGGSGNDGPEVDAIEVLP